MLIGDTQLLIADDEGEGLVLFASSTVEPSEWREVNPLTTV